MGVLTGAILPDGQTPSQAVGSLAAQHILAWGAGAEPQGIQLLSWPGQSSSAEPASTSSSMGSWEFPLPREEIAPILSLAGAKDFDFLFFFFFPPAKSKLTIPLQGRMPSAVWERGGDNLWAAGRLPKEAALTHARTSNFGAVCSQFCHHKGKTRHASPLSQHPPGPLWSLLQPPPCTATVSSHLHFAPCA